MATQRKTTSLIRHWKQQQQRPILALTAYDYPMSRLLDEAGVDVLHVGDSLGMVVYGHPDTTSVTMNDMVRHTQAVANARRSAYITADLPAKSYETPADALANARRLMDAGADAVKMEGGREIESQIELLIQEGIPVQGHLGMLPQKVVEEGGYRKKGKLPHEAQKIKDDALWMDKIGVFSVVLESVNASLAFEITRELRIPTIGIGSGFQTTGQIRVIHDVIGFYPWFEPPFAKPKIRIHQLIDQAVREWSGEMNDHTAQASK